MKLSSKLNALLQKSLLTDEEVKELANIQSELDKHYQELPKGAYIRCRVKWMEDEERNSSYFFSLEKRNVKRNSISTLNINGNYCADPKQISAHVTQFYTYLDQSSQTESEGFFQLVRGKTPVIDSKFKTMCDSLLSPSEIRNAIMNMKKKEITRCRWTHHRVLHTFLGH